MNWILIFPYVCLYLTVITLWFPNASKPLYWSSLFFVALSLGLITNLLEPIALIPIFILACGVYASSSKNYFLKGLAGLGVLVVCIGLALHKLPGFHNVTLYKDIYFSPDALPYTLNLNSDKAVIGILILGIGHRLINSRKDWIKLFKQLSIFLILFVPLMIIFSFLLGFVRFDPKFPNETFIWALTNLLFVCVAEEAFFRGFIQKNIALMMSTMRYGGYWAILSSSLLFGLAHFAGGSKYILLATIAGLGYGWIYYATRRIEGSIVTHFTLNLTHFLFFTYPALAG